ncbi:glycosyl transferase [Streptococcus dysgalactiae]|uniref:glycosyl transferase n=2 Tax=Streptococcus TaxID=1301 RepID=UPI000617C0E4|nr:glycosyl transferase [Streptococcus dysgalactiae]KKC19694.1 glycosyltransferase [Streptococcus dysgalactiae subsp. equisimilis]VTT00052.1 glycosyl transferase family protein [Streptococcus dysgalactiae subsp. equisimilis]VUC99020.1 glycosyl transferase family protein [Streptococcus sp. NCTC 11567]
MYQGKRFLLTHIWLRGFSGAEINILELATYLKEAGAQVEVFTFLAKSPMLDEFQKNGIPVIDDSDYPFDVSQYDVVCSAQNIIPPAMIEALGKSQEKLPKFIFFHMAALPEHVLEQPYIYQLEKKISSATLAISEEIVNKNLKRFFKDIPNLHYYPNPAPESYAAMEHLKKQSPERILVISNHPPQEVIDMEPLLAKKGIHVDYFGVWSDHYELVTPELLASYDCVVGIGKNAQYCLVMGKPIYIYDHFKGPGYLTETNFEAAALNNFSGRGFEEQEKTAEELVDDLLEHYQSAQAFQHNHLYDYRSRYTISTIVDHIYKSINIIPKAIAPLEQVDVEYIKAITLFIRTRLVRLENDVANLWEAVHRYEQLDQKATAKREALEQLLTAKTTELNLIKTSRMFKLYQLLWRIKGFFFRKEHLKRAK